MTKSINYTRLILSLGMIVFVGALVIGATGAFFSDTETSTGNVFAAGAVDLKIDNSSYGFDWNDPTVTDPIGAWGLNAANSWDIDDLTDQLFFNFHDLKPGDYGEDTISIHVDDNDAWACMAFDLTGTPENDLNEAEDEAGDVTPGVDEGELQNYLSFLFWNDDGDNILEDNEVVIDSLSGLSSDIFSGEWLTIADGVGQDAPLPGGTTQYIGKGWCFGDIAADPEPQDGNGDGAPTAETTGFICDGTGDQNDAQTDGIEVDVAFYAEQSRNNAQFSCAALPPLDGEGGEPDDRELVGAALGAYSTPSTCDVTVDDDGAAPNTIAEGITLATSGQTVCVADGSYDGPVEVNKAITLASMNGPAVTTINGGVKITSSDVTVTGFTVNTGVVSGEPNPVGFYVAEGDNISIDSNDIDGNDVALSTGVLFVTGAAYTNVEVTNNDIHDNNAGIYTNPHTGIIDITFNDIFDNNAGIGGFMGANVTNNEFDHTVAAQEAIGADSTYDASPTSAEFNNFLNGSMLNDYGAVAIIGAENNFWNLGGVNQTTVGQVDFDPEEGSAFPHN